MTPDSDLLRPSLSPGREVPNAIYSVRAVFLTSCFGGPIGAVLITLINAHRLRRLSREWPLALAALAIVVALRWSASRHALAGLEAYLGARTEGLLMELASFAFFGIGYALHAPYHRSHALLDLPAPNGLTAGILCVLAATGVEMGLVWMVP
jgi:hypothetical protein